MATDVNVVKVEFDIDTKDISKAQKDYEGLIKDIDNTKLSVDKLSASLDKENQSVATSKQKMAELQAEHKRLQQEIKKTGDNSGELSKRAQKVNQDFKETSEKFKTATQNTKTLGEQMKNTAKDTEKMSGGMGKLKDVIGGVFAVGGVIAFGQAVFDATAKQEQFNIALTSMLKSKAQADILAGQLVNLAVKTPFELTELQDATKRLIAFGFSASEIEPALLKLGDTASGIGAPIGDLAYLFGTIRTQGRAMTVDINQFANRGIPVWEELAKITGKNGTELRKFVEAGKVGYEEINQVFTNLTTNGGKFAGLMEAQSKSLGGMLSNLSDSWNQFLTSIGNNSNVVFAGILKTASFVLERMGEVVASEESKMDKLATEQAKAITISVDGWTKYFNTIKGGNDEIEKSFEQQQQNIADNLKKEQDNLAKFYNEIKQSGMILSQAIPEDELTTLGKTGEVVGDVLIKQKTLITKLSSDLTTLKDAYKKYNEEKTKEIELAKTNNAELKKIQENNFKEELRILAIKEQNAKVESELFGDSATEKLQIEQDFNDKRIAIYEKYNAILTKTDLETKEGLNFNSASILDKIEKQTEIESKAKIDAQRKSWAEEQTEQDNLDKQAIKRQEDRTNYRKNIILEEEAETLAEVEQMTFKSEEDKQKAILEVEKEYKDLQLREELDLINKKIELNKYNKDELNKLTKEQAEKELEILRNKNAKEVEDTKDTEAKKLREREKAIVLGKQIVDTLLTIYKESYRQDIQNQSDALNFQREQELENKNLTESEKEAIEKKYKKLQLDLKIKEFNFNKAMALSEVAVNTAIAVSKVAAQAGVKSPLLIPFIITLGVAQAVAISARQPPKYFKGTDYLDLNGNKKGVDTIPILAHEGERILPTADNLAIGGKGLTNKELVKLVKLGQLVRSGQIEVKQKQSNVIVNVDNQELVNAYKSQPKLAISMDENGYNKYLYKQNKKTEILNKRYGN
jgi:tape measure domain-containing protein